MNEVFRRAMFLEMSNYPIDHRDCIRQAVREIVPDYEFVDMYALYGITYEEYIEDMTNSYLRYKSERISEAWRKANLKD